jgi:hypothetical protein|tara:strand:+ start:589 stop:729 length:141 start_codon:yes stop_codon:yes gene_type:complete
LVILLFSIYVYRNKSFFFLSALLEKESLAMYSWFSLGKEKGIDLLL